MSENIKQPKLHELRAPEHRLILISRKTGIADVIDGLLLPVLILAPAGLFYWAIRGSGGYGGSSGGTFAGLGWALAWFFISHEGGEVKKRPYSSGWTVLAIILGIAIGGLHGYGQFLSWIRGVFFVNQAENPPEIVPLNPVWGWAWLFQCGLAWGGNTGVFLAWCGSKQPPKKKDWAMRFILSAAGIIVFQILFYAIPSWFLPHYSGGYYDPGRITADTVRTYTTAQSSIIWLGLLVGNFIFELGKKDWRNVLLILTLGLGFAISFTLGANWFLVGDVIGLPIDFWKNWEMSIGFGGGLTFAICHFLFNRKFSLDDLVNVRTRPFTKYRNLEKQVGINLIVTIALLFVIYNGTSQFLTAFLGDYSAGWLYYLEVPDIESNIDDTATLAIPKAIIVIAIIVLSLFFTSVVRTIKNPARLMDGKDNIPNPAMRFITIQVILNILGIMVTIYPQMGFASGFLILVYTIALNIAYLGFFLLMTRKNGKTKLEEEKTEWIVEMMKNIASKKPKK
ncbi:MAG: hypothetical protein ACTSRA_03360 [Promethearchaeota archaeon]